MAVLVQNENMVNESFNFKGETYACDEKGVVRCSELLADFLLSNNPGNHWKPYTRDLKSDAATLKQDVMQCEANLRAAERALTVARDKLKAFENEVEDVVQLDQATIPEPKEAPPVEAPETEISAEDYPTMMWTKQRIVAFAEAHEIDIDPSDTKGDLIAAIEAATEEE